MKRKIVLYRKIEATPDKGYKKVLAQFDSLPVFFWFNLGKQTDVLRLNAFQASFDNFVASKEWKVAKWNLMKLKTKQIIAFFKLQHQGSTWVSPRLVYSPKQRFHSDKTATNAQKHNKIIRIFVCSIAREILFQLPIQVLRYPVNSVADLRQNANKIPVT